MFKKKDYIKVRGIGKIQCKPELSASDVRLICTLAERLPFYTSLDDNATESTQEFLPEMTDYSIFVALISVATDYDLKERDIWADYHCTTIAQDLYIYYSAYIEEIFSGALQRIDARAKATISFNGASLFDGVAKALEGVNIEDVLSLAQNISQMDGKEIVKAALETDAP